VQAICVSNGSVNALSTCKMTSILLLTLDFAVTLLIAAKWFQFII